MAQAIRISEEGRSKAGNGAKSLAFSSRVGLFTEANKAAWLSLVPGLALSGIGHGALAAATGMLGKALVQPSGPGMWGVSLLEVSYLGLGAASVKAAGSILLGFSEISLAGGISRQFRERLVDRLRESGLPDAAPRVLATLAVRLPEVEAAVVQGALRVGRALAQLGPIALGLILVSPSLALVGTSVLLPFALGVAALRRALRRSNERAQSAAEELHAGVHELVENLDLWRTYGASDRVAKFIARAGERAVRASARVAAQRAALSGMNEVLGALALVGLIALAARAGFSFGDGTLVAFTAMCFMAYRPLRDLGDARAWVTRGHVALDAIEETLREVDPRDAAIAGARERLDPDLLEAVEVGARERGPRTSFSLLPGEAIAIVGPTGSGKTTLIRALLGLEPAVGSLRYGNREIIDVAAGPAHRPFAWVPQAAPLVTGTILENVALFGSGESRARIALAELGAERLLGRAGEIVGPGGTPLSGGERRLVSIARAMATELPILLIDEPTEGLDLAARNRVIEALERVKGQRALVIVTHHAEVAAIADRVIKVGSRAHAPVIAAE